MYLERGNRATKQIDGISFKPIKITDIHQGIIKIVDGEFFYDFQLNTTQSFIVGRDREEVLNQYPHNLAS